LEPVTSQSRFVAMPNFLIRVVNDEFIAENEEEHPSAEMATEQAIKGALSVGVDAIIAGKPFFAAEVIVAEGNARQRYAVAIGVSSLK
jgi:hypothetical protein